MPLYPNADESFPEAHFALKFYVSFYSFYSFLLFYLWFYAAATTAAVLSIILSLFPHSLFFFFNSDFKKCWSRLTGANISINVFKA